MCRVLILDDNRDYAEIVKLALETAEEATAEITTNLPEAIEKTLAAAQHSKPYEVFLVDQLLGPGKDGIESMRELRNLSPDTDAIIFTGDDNLENGLRAYEAGAFRYLQKPFTNRELIYILKALKQRRKEQREHDWQKIFTSMTEAALRERAFLNVAQVVVDHALKLGFERAHLFWEPTKDDATKNIMMVGIQAAGKNHIPHFSDRLFPLRTWGDLRVALQSHDVTLLRSKNPKEILVALQCRDDFPFPHGDWCILPLWSGENLLGALLLDYGQIHRNLGEHERTQLNFFARQVSVVLEHASMVGRIQLSEKDANLISNIGRYITSMAATDNLSPLLREVREQVTRHIPASNFAVILTDEATGNLDFHYLYEHGHEYEGIIKRAGSGLEGYLLNNKEEILLATPLEVETFAQQHQIRLEGETPASWLGVPLKISDRAFGAIVLQRIKHKKPFSEHEQHLLASVADQIAGAIQLSRSAENEHLDAERLDTLRQASAEMLSLAQEKEEYLWHTVLTLATSNFGTGFNRALLFLANEDGTKLVGRFAIGTEDTNRAMRDWERDKKRGYTFGSYLRDLRANKIPATEFEKLVTTIEFELNGHQDAIAEALHGQKYVLVKTGERQERLPGSLTAKIDLAECAVLPLLAGRHVLGAMIVDNKHNNNPLNPNALNRLQTVLNNAGVVRETLRQRHKSEELLDANYRIMGASGREPLNKTLKAICETARAITEADWVVIYPLKEGKVFEFDAKNWSAAGKLQFPIEQSVNKKPASNGVTAHILKTGQKVVPDMDSREARVGRIRFADHLFIQHEGVKAMIGIAIRDAQTGESLGVLYLNYRKPRNFSELEVHHAASFASLAAVAIQNSRRLDEQKEHSRMKAALEIAEAIGTELDMEKMLQEVLQKLRGFFKKATLCVLLYDEDNDALKFAPGTQNFYPIDRSGFKNIDSFPLKGPSLACTAARKSQRSHRARLEHAPDVQARSDYLPLSSKTRSELCVGLMSSQGKLLGVLALERQIKHGFSKDDIALVETVASQISMALERAQQGERLDFTSTVAAAYVWAADLAHDINREVFHIRGWADAVKDESANNPLIKNYAEKIEESAAILASAGPWTNPNPETLPLDETVRKNIEVASRQREIAVEMELHCPQTYIRVNPVAFQRVFRQLVRNAWQAMQETPEKKIIVRTRKLEDDKNIEIQFQDFGPGVSETARLSILQRRVTTKGRGGYGLLFTRQMIEDMGGKIRLLPSEPGKGATFSIKFPCSAHALLDGSPEVE